jgi:hypothetical protein
MITTKKIDLKKKSKQLYTAFADEISEVLVPAANYLMIDGKGDPNVSKEYGEAIEALFSAAYALKFAVKKTRGIDYSVMPLEGLWWTEGGKPFESEKRNAWCWSAIILQPEYVTPQLFRDILEDMKKKQLPALSRLRFDTYSEGKAVQVMHSGPYSEEHSTIARLHQYVRDHGYTLVGKHHEIYLNTPQRTAPEKLKTILRQPVHEALTAP